MTASYPTRKVGKDNVSAIGFGAMGISAYYGDTGSDEERLKVLDAAFESGCTFWDTANIYGDSEELIGKWFKRTGKRDQVFLATKFGIVHDTKSGVDGSAQNVEKSFKQSLERLGVTYLDLYYLHRPDPNIPIEVTVGAMAKLVKQAKVKYLGLSECSANTLRRANAIHPTTAVQLEYSPFELELEQNDLLETARKLGIQIIAYSPLGRGLLTGRYVSTVKGDIINDIVQVIIDRHRVQRSPEDFEKDDFRRLIPRFSQENFPKILRLVDELQNIGKEYNATAGQVTLSWILAQGEDFIPIPGTKKIKYLEENLAAARINLAPEAVQKVRKIVEEAALHGDRYPAHSKSLLYSDTPSYTKTER